jgi:putative acetyltransferase
MIEIRAEMQADFKDIHEITESAFKDRPYADGDEHELIEKLRSVQALTLSLVAVDSGQLVGQITFSPATLSSGSQPWFALGPISVLPSRQGEGVGSKLINEGLRQIQELGALGCILTGDPDYYSRFGFDFSPQNVPENEPVEYFMLKVLKGQSPDGKFSFHGAFYGEDA